jgi:hypothetical protein
MNEAAIDVPLDRSGEVVLRTAIYRPGGPGSFTMIVFNHSRTKGDPGICGPVSPSASQRVIFTTAPLQACKSGYKHRGGSNAPPGRRYVDTA